MLVTPSAVFVRHMFQQRSAGENDGNLSRVVKGQFSPQVLVLAACLPFFSFNSWQTSATSVSNGQREDAYSANSYRPVEEQQLIFHKPPGNKFICRHVSKFSSTTDDNVQRQCCNGVSLGSLLPARQFNQPSTHSCAALSEEPRNDSVS